MQLGFVTGAVGATVLNLADRVRPQLLLAGAAAVGAVLTLVLGLFVDGMGRLFHCGFSPGSRWPGCIRSG